MAAPTRETDSERHNATIMRHLALKVFPGSEIQYGPHPDSHPLQERPQLHCTRLAKAIKGHPQFTRKIIDCNESSLAGLAQRHRGRDIDAPPAAAQSCRPPSGIDDQPHHPAL